MRKINLSTLMRSAWEFFRSGKAGTFADSLRMAWRNAKAILKAKEAAQVKAEAHTWYGWKERGYEVIHESKAIFKVVVEDVKTRSGYRTLAYFTKGQVQAV